MKKPLVVVACFVVAAVVLVILPSSCSEAEEPKTPAERGRRDYLMFCAACHHPGDPSKPGAQGPDVAGSSLELLRAKVLRNDYPEGYEPKRETRNMVPLALNDDQLHDIAAYLAQGRAVR